MLVEIAIGDAYGRPFEFRNSDYVKENNDLQYSTGGGIYTDDTQMSLAIAEHMLENLPITQQSYAAKFVEAYHRDKRPGYSRRMQSILNSSYTGKGMTEKCDAPSTANGCMMRAVPLGLYPDPEKVKFAALVQASVTHPHVEAIIAAQYTALSAHYFYYHSRVITKDFYRWINAIVGHGANQISMFELNGPLPSQAIPTTGLVVNSIALHLENNDHVSQKDLLWKMIDCEGDTDSSGAVAMGLSSLLKNQVLKDLPKTLFKNLENLEYGYEYLKSIDKQLFKKFPRITKATSFTALI